MFLSCHLPSTPFSFSHSYSSLTLLSFSPQRKKVLLLTCMTSPFPSLLLFLFFLSTILHGGFRTTTLISTLLPSSISLIVAYTYSTLSSLSTPSILSNLIHHSIHHPTELLSKSTAIHARIICPDDVSIHEFPDIPDYNLDETVLLFPSDVCPS